MFKGIRQALRHGIVVVVIQRPNGRLCWTGEEFSKELEGIEDFKIIRRYVPLNVRGRLRVRIQRDS